MTPKTSGCALEALADRIEKLTGPDREVDMQVKAAIYGGVAMISPFNGEWCLYREGSEDARSGKSFECPHRVQHAVWLLDRYTASLDAAMTTVPEGWLTERAQQDHDGAEWHWRLYPAFASHRGVWAQASSAARALLSAALRARSQAESLATGDRA